MLEINRPVGLPLKKLCIVLVFMSVVMAAEVVKHFFPKLVELHNYTPAHSTQQKLSNWNTLNRQANLFVFQADGNKKILCLYDLALPHTLKGINKTSVYSLSRGLIIE